MIIDNTAGLQFFLNDDIYLLRQDMDKLGNDLTEPSPAVIQPAVMIQESPVTKTEEPVVMPEQPVVAEDPALYFNHLGGNARQFLILCSYPETGNMDEKHLAALTSALQRKELALADVAILNLAKHSNPTVTDLHQYFKPSRLLMLGAPCLLAGWDKFALNQLENLNGIKALYTYSFTEMMGDRDKTKAFWEQMKVL